MYIKQEHKNKSGYIAIVSALIISAIALSLVTSSSLIAVSDLQSSFESRQHNKGLGLVEGCVEDVLLRLSDTDFLSSSVSIPEGVCSVVLNSHIGANWNFDVSGSFYGRSYVLRADVDRTYRVVINSIEQLPY